MSDSFERELLSIRDRFANDLERGQWGFVGVIALFDKSRHRDPGVVGLLSHPTSGPTIPISTMIGQLVGALGELRMMCPLDRRAEADRIIAEASQAGFKMIYPQTQGDTPA